MFFEKNHSLQATFSSNAERRSSRKNKKAEITRIIFTKTAKWSLIDKNMKHEKCVECKRWAHSMFYLKRITCDCKYFWRNSRNGQHSINGLNRTHHGRRTDWMTIEISSTLLMMNAIIFKFHFDDSLSMNP